VKRPRANSKATKYTICHATGKATRFDVVDLNIVDFNIVDFNIVDFNIVDFNIVDFNIVDFNIEYLLNYSSISW
jgi:hypothetical protein